MLGVAYKKGGVCLKGRGCLLRAGGAYFSLELEVSLIYMFLPKNILEHSISFYPVPSPSSMFQGVTCTGFVTFCHLLEHSGSFLPILTGSPLFWLIPGIFHFLVSW